MRILRMTYLARTKPEMLADCEFSQPEIDATIVLKRRKTKYKRGQVPTIGEIVRWIAELGGYTGKSSGGRPGALVLTRGLHRIEPLAQAFADGL